MALQVQDQQSFHKSRDVLPKIDKSNRFCSPKAARELASLIVYASCLQGSDPIWLFEKWINAAREQGYEFDKDSLLQYNHMSFGEPPVTTQSIEEADELLCSDEQDSTIEAEVLSAPPKLVYSKLILSFTRKLLVATVDKLSSACKHFNNGVDQCYLIV
ncbi:Antitermination NusB domain-containing protein isoform 2 [Hibiscus syriacus]|uniref:Antitermination NusB domain-containing protein isoform 2 n=2 Tax=Hibiscus syriacus TaxID=106335 RepID=A0A6A2YJT1_HIBSY|nr:Antitermination NusB domain-containing protein isoform 2 [Hibiscus syriacus]